MSLGQTYLERLRFGVNAAPPDTRTATTGVPGF
jgi:hypothetical protein